MSEKSDKLSKGSEMVTSDARDLLCTVAGRPDWSDNRKSWLSKAARRLGFSYARTRSIFYGEARIIRAEEWIRLNEEAAALKRSAQERQEALNDLDLLARSAVPTHREAARPLGVARVEPQQPGPWGKRQV